MSVSYSISKFKMFPVVFSPVNLFNCSKPSCVCAGSEQAWDWLSVLTDCGKGLRGKERNVESWHRIEIEKDDTIVSGEVNKWGVKAELDWEALLRFRTHLLRIVMAFVCPGPAPWVRMTGARGGPSTSQVTQRPSSEFQKVILVVRVAFLLGLNQRGQSYL